MEEVGLPVAVRRLRSPSAIEVSAYRNMHPPQCIEESQNVIDHFRGFQIGRHRAYVPCPLEANKEKIAPCNHTHSEDRVFFS